MFFRKNFNGFSFCLEVCRVWRSLVSKTTDDQVTNVRINGASGGCCHPDAQRCRSGGHFKVCCQPNAQNFDNASFILWTLMLHAPIAFGPSCRHETLKRSRDIKPVVCCWCAVSEFQLIYLRWFYNDWSRILFYHRSCSLSHGRKLFLFKKKCLASALVLL